MRLCPIAIFDQKAGQDGWSVCGWHSKLVIQLRSSLTDILLQFLESCIMEGYCKASLAMGTFQFCEDFVSKIDDLRSCAAATHLQINFSHIKPDPLHCGSVLYNLPEISPSEVLELLSNLPKKSTYLDFIPTCLLKESSSTFSGLIAYLANLFSSQVHFPSQLNLQCLHLYLKPCS